MYFPLRILLSFNFFLKVDALYYLFHLDYFFLHTQFLCFFLSPYKECKLNSAVVRLQPIPQIHRKLSHTPPQDAFGGNSLCLMVCCLSPSSEDFDATFHTLKYGGMARYIFNCPAVNMAIQNSAPASSSTTTLTPSSPHTTLRVGVDGGLCCLGVLIVL